MFFPKKIKRNGQLKYFTLLGNLFPNSFKEKTLKTRMYFWEIVFPPKKSKHEPRKMIYTSGRQFFLKHRNGPKKIVYTSGEVTLIMIVT